MAGLAAGAPKGAQSDNSLFQTLIATAVDGIVVIDERGIVQVYNLACERLFRYGADEVVGQNVKILMPLPYRDEHDSYLDHYRSTAKPALSASDGRFRDGARTVPYSRSICRWARAR